MRTSGVYSVTLLFYIIVSSVLFEDTYSAFDPQYGPRHSVFSHDSARTGIEYPDDTLLAKQQCHSIVSSVASCSMLVNVIS